MCIIVAKKKGVALPSKDILETCFYNNNDGAGLMFVNKGKVNIVKGFMKFKDFYDYLMKLDKIHNFKEKSLVMHFRISTGGNVDGGNCHPYPISSNEKDLRKTYITTDLGMAHNGIISTYSRTHEVLNDTQMFIKRCVSVIKKSNDEFYKDYETMELLADIAGSKLCFLDKNDNLYYVGKFVEEDGIMYSNTTYMSWYYYPTTYNYKYDYSKYSNNYEYYDEIIEDKKSKENKPLTVEEFEICIDNITLLDEGVTIRYFDATKGGYNEFVIPTKSDFGIDDFLNLYYVDWENNDITLLYEDCDLIYGTDDFSDFVEQVNDEVAQSLLA